MDDLFESAYDLATSVELACRIEAEAPKAGNVHPNAAFADCNFQDFLLSASALKHVFRDVASLSTGSLIFHSVQETVARVGKNTNLGMILLLGPLAKAAAETRATEKAKETGEANAVSSLALAADRQGFTVALTATLSQLDVSDCRLVYEAIRTAQPGGIGKTAQNDVHSGETPPSLISAMQHVAEIDAVARQYTNNFADVRERLLPWFEEYWQELLSLPQSNRIHESVCWLQLRWLAHEPDGLIVRKRGLELAQEIQEMSQAVLSAAPRGIPISTFPPYQKLDAFLRVDGNSRNPGTTADLIAATLFVKLLFPKAPSSS